MAQLLVVEVGPVHMLVVPEGANLGRGRFALPDCRQLWQRCAPCPAAQRRWGGRQVGGERRVARGTWQEGRGAEHARGRERRERKEVTRARAEGRGAGVAPGEGEGEG